MKYIHKPVEALTFDEFDALSRQNSTDLVWNGSTFTKHNDNVWLLCQEGREYLFERSQVIYFDGISVGLEFAETFFKLHKPIPEPVVRTPRAVLEGLNGIETLELLNFLKLFKKG